jgi:1-acyl-sn-glycerol-3-phosphate acyltransferase
MKNAPLSFPFRALKWSGMVLVVLLFVATGLALALLPLSKVQRRAVRTRTTSFFSGVALSICGVRVRVHHRERLAQGRQGRLIVANHVSYVDVLVLSSLSPMVFITSVEMKHTPLLGLLASWGGSLFVERRRPAGLRREIDEIAGALKEGASVMLFPEGTTSNGERVHTFKRSLFDAALAAGVPVLPLCLRYTSINGEAVTRSNRDSLFYYGGVTFSEHIPRFLATRSCDAEVFVLKRIAGEGTAGRKELAGMAHDSISKAYLS